MKKQGFESCGHIKSLETEFNNGIAQNFTLWVFSCKVNFGLIVLMKPSFEVYRPKALDKDSTLK